MTRGTGKPHAHELLWGILRDPLLMVVFTAAVVYLGVQAWSVALVLGVAA